MQCAPYHWHSVELCPVGTWVRLIPTLAFCLNTPCDVAFISCTQCVIVNYSHAPPTMVSPWACHGPPAPALLEISMGSVVKIHTNYQYVPRGSLEPSIKGPWSLMEWFFDDPTQS
ncbi:hypothetical protein O181_013011 [Austropuccinia psidii MF-1]|uniref:Uncharacterized protein n=1 Tax=Austropuccinia psidii MF-1 TaxID=1389203 RepID=A0A9Q3BVL8_9BASI|nr:hypothetical protein [Austropuccinia psidii MF-1]